MTFWKNISWTKINAWLAGTESKTKEQLFDERKATFVANIDARQKLFNDLHRGASWTEMILTLENRIHDLETQVNTRAEPPLLTAVVPPEELIVKKVRKPRPPKLVKPTISVKSEAKMVESPVPATKPVVSVIAPITLTMTEPEVTPTPVTPKRIRKPRTPK